VGSGAGTSGGASAITSHSLLVHEEGFKTALVVEIGLYSACLLCPILG
jgi:hypothetical protein